MSRTILSKFNAPHPPTHSPSGEVVKLVACWKSPSNIALVKYWGKKEGQLALNPSISMTLNQSSTLTCVEAEFTREAGGRICSVNSDIQHLFLPKMEKLLKWLVQEIPILGNLTFRVETSNSFPHSTGIASSASGISAFTLCLLSIAEKVNGEKLPIMEFMKMASFASRMGSGSACRSVFGGFTIWGKTKDVRGSSDLFAVPVSHLVHSSLSKLHDAILVVSTTPKNLPSSHGHLLMDNHPFKTARISQARNNLSELLSALKTGDFNHLAELAENEALTLHALIMSSTGGMILMEPSTVQIIKQIRAARQRGLAVFFTLDAGPNVHLLYPEAAVSGVKKFIRSELTSLCENGLVIYDYCGSGPVRPKSENQ